MAKRTTTRRRSKVLCTILCIALLLTTVGRAPNVYAENLGVGDEVIGLRDFCSKTYYLGGDEYQCVIKPINATGVTGPGFSNLSDWPLAINSYITYSDGTIYRDSSYSFHLSLNYRIYDFYDWDKTSTDNFYDFTQSAIWLLHYAGMAQQFEVFGSKTFSYTY